MQPAEQILKNGKVILREDADCWRAGQQLIESAQVEAAAITASATAYRQAEAQRGYDEGMTKARDEQREMIMATIAMRDAYLRRLKDEMAEVVINAVRKIFSDFDDTQKTRIIVGKALRTLSNQKQATVRVHPGQYQAIRDSIDSLTAECPHLSSLRIERDPDLGPGACMLLSDLGNIETDIESQIRSLERSLLTAACREK